MVQKKEIPVYFINGFLEAGKTNFIQFTINEDYFQIDGKTLLILCEEGMEEYDEEILKKSNTVVEVFENQDEFTAEALKALEAKHDPERIIIEFNGMWDLKKVIFPGNWVREQQITIVDGSTFAGYFANMKSMFLDMVRYSDLVLFNRAVATDDLLSYRRMILAVNNRAQIVFEDEEGELDVVGEEDLPYDVNAPVIELAEEAYPIWYLDAMEQEERYNGKTVEFLAMVYKPRNFPVNQFAPGRFVMTCCADDVSFLGFICRYAGAPRLKTRQWIKVTAEIRYETMRDYNGKGPVLYATKVEPASKPAQEVLGLQ